MRAFAEGVVWVVAGVAVWLATVPAVTIAEVAVAVPTAVACAALAVVARRSMGLRFRAGREWLLWAVLVPVSAVADSVRLARLLVRRAPEPGEQEALVRRRVPAGPAASALGWRAAAIVAVSATPASVVVDADGEAGRIVLHRLVAGRPAIDERVSS